MARQKPVYRGESRPGWIITLAVAVLVAVILAGFWLFYDLQQHLIYDKDGIRLAPAGADAAALSADGGGGGKTAVRELPLIDVEIVVDKTDYTGTAGTDGAGLETLHGRFVSAENVTAATLNSYTFGLGGSYNALVLEMKPASGLLAWQSTVALADSYGVNGTFEMSDYIARLKESGVRLVAQLSCLPDGTMGVRNSPIALKSAENDGLYLSPGGQAWLDPYNDVTRAYLSALMEELRDMGFDEILLTGLYLPEDGTYRFGGEMTATPDGASAVSSLALYLRARADELGLCLSAQAERDSLRERQEGEAPVSQDAAVFFKAFDRVAYPADYGGADSYAALSAALGSGDAEKRIVPVYTGFLPEQGSYIVK